MVVSENRAFGLTMEDPEGEFGASEPGSPERTGLGMPAVVGAAGLKACIVLASKSAGLATGACKPVRRSGIENLGLGPTGGCELDPADLGTGDDACGRTRTSRARKGGDMNEAETGGAMVEEAAGVVEGAAETFPATAAMAGPAPNCPDFSGDGDLLAFQDGTLDEISGNCSPSGVTA